MFYLLVALILIVALLMGIVILLQNGKGGGLAGIASGGQTTQILGARQAPDFLEKATWGLGSAFLFLCLMTTFAIPREGAGRSILQDRADELPAGTVAPTTPGTGAPGTAVPGTAPLPDASTTPAAPQQTPVSPGPAPGPAPAN